MSSSITRKIARVGGNITQAINSAAFHTAGRFAPCPLTETIVIAGSPRSGTTLIQEALQLLPEYKALNEPLLKKEVQRQHGFESRPFITSETATPSQTEFIRQSLTGQLGADARWAFPKGSHLDALAFHAKRRKLIVKFCRINRSLPWLTKTFDARGYLFVVRHPCSVINSMLRFGQWTRDFVGTQDDPSSPIYVKHLPASTRAVFEPIVQDIKTQEEALATIWSLDHYLPLVENLDHSWILMPYEKLVRKGATELERVAKGLGVSVNQQMRNALERPSSSVKESYETDATRQLSKWKQQLSPEQISSILKVVDRAGLSKFYDDDIDPNYAELATHQDARFRG